MLSIRTEPGDYNTGAISVANVTSLFLDAPVNTQVGDDLVVVIASSASTALAVDAGWTLISRPLSEASPTARNLAAYRYHVGSTIPVTSQFRALATSAARLAGIVFRVTGADSTAFTAGLSLWPTATPESSTSTIAIPSFTPAASGHATIVAAYSNISAGGTIATATVPGMTQIAHVPSTVGATTTLDVFTGTGGGARTVTWSSTVANSYGFQLALRAEPAPPSATWEARVFKDGALLPADLFAMGSGGLVTSVSLANWSPREFTISDLLSTTPFYLAHRGSGDTWPEHTMEAYTNAAAYGIKALEVSVNKSADGVLFCHHDTNGLKMTGSPDSWSTMQWADIQQLWNDSSPWTGTSTPKARIPLLKDVLDAYAHTHVIFIEDKQGTSTTQMLNLMDTYPNATNHFVWKTYASATAQADAARLRGYKAWGYFMTANFNDMDALVSHYDYLGIPHTASDTVIAQSVAYGKPVICWEIHYRWMRDRVAALGVKGMMTSNIPYVYSTSVAEFTRDQFRTGLRTPGDLPHTTDTGWSLQPGIDKATATLKFAMNPSVGYGLFSMCPVPSLEYVVDFEMRWPSQMPNSTQHAGGFFGRSDDRPHRTSASLPTGGYHFLIRDTGRVDLFRHDPNSAAGIPLDQVNGPALVPGQWMKFRATISATEVTFSRMDVTPVVTARSTDTLYRGPYFGLSKNYSVDPIANPGAVSPLLEYRNVTVVPL